MKGTQNGKLEKTQDKIYSYGNNRNYSNDNITTYRSDS